MKRATIASSPDIPGVTRISSDPEMPRPHVGILGAVHGNEPCGMRVLDRIVAMAEAGEIAPTRGTWVLIHGNPEASVSGRRYTRGGADLNRLFDFAFEEDLPRERWSPEHHRAHELRPILEELDTLLDLHSASWPTPPFAIINDMPEAVALARRLGLGFVTHGWGGPGLLMDKVSIGVMQRCGRPAVSIECGQHDDPETIDAAFECAQRYLCATGTLEGEAPESDPTFLQVVEIISRPSEGFKLTRVIRGLERLEAGEIFAADKVTELRVREPCFVLMPNDAVPVGRDMVFLARDVRALRA
jgi:succinylglutamate desuccinylase